MVVIFLNRNVNNNVFESGKKKKILKWPVTIKSLKYDHGPDEIQNRYRRKTKRTRNPDPKIYFKNQ